MLERVSKFQPNDSAVDTRRRPQPEEGPLSILYEDEAMLVLDKPAGIVIHPTYKNTSGTLLNAVLWRMRDRVDPRPGILTRLDKDTSGVVVIALMPEVHAAMQRDAAAGRVDKAYLAVVRGTPDPPAGRIRLPLARDPQDRRRVIATADGAPSETRYELVASRDGRSLLRCTLITGRTHQIRVHLASNGWPIVGDAVYGQADATMPRQALHASRIELPHPITRVPLAFQTPAPPDLQPLIAAVLGEPPP
jgi:23S rRNA pseudouridine1911/1915/1917 synthase